MRPLQHAVVFRCFGSVSTSDYALDIAAMIRAVLTAAKAMMRKGVTTVTSMFNE